MGVRHRATCYGINAGGDGRPDSATPPMARAACGAWHTTKAYTFGIKNPASKLKDKAVYARSDVHVSGNKAIPRNGA